MTDQMRVGQVIDALIAIAGQVEGFRLQDDPSETPLEELVTVWDGPEWGTTEDHAAGGHVVIGGGIDRDAPAAAVDTTWQAGPIATTVRARDERGQVACSAVAQRHDTAQGARNEVLAIVSVFAQVCRQMPDLGIDSSATVGGVRTVATLSAGSLTQWLNRGFNARLDFTITYETRV